MSYSILAQEFQGINLHLTICSNRMENPRVQVMLSVLFLIHHSLILGLENMPLTIGPQDYLNYQLLIFLMRICLRLSINDFCTQSNIVETENYRICKMHSTRKASKSVEELGKSITCYDKLSWRSYWAPVVMYYKFYILGLKACKTFIMPCTVLRLFDIECVRSFMYTLQCYTSVRKQYELNIMDILLQHNSSLILQYIQDWCKAVTQSFFWGCHYQGSLRWSVLFWVSPQKYLF